MTIYNGNYTVYIHTNMTNGKRYVGITCKKPERRWGHQGSGYKTQQLFWRAIQKYGWDNFDHEIFASKLTKDEACNIEVILIEKLQTNDPKYGYNYERGGRCHTNESRRKIGDSELGSKHHYFGKHRSEETKKKISESLTGENHYWYGKHLPDETKRKISESSKGRKKAPNAGTQPLPIKCIETQIVYSSTAEAARQLGICHSGITSALKGRRNSAGGFHWQYANMASSKAS